MRYRRVSIMTEAGYAADRIDRGGVIAGEKEMDLRLPARGLRQSGIQGPQ